MNYRNKFILQKQENILMKLYSHIMLVIIVLLP